MARGNGIIVSANPLGMYDEGFIKTGETPKPGVVLQIDASVALVGGRHTYKQYARDADGNRPDGPICILLHDYLQGKTPNDAYVAGTRCFVYIPKDGEEFNMWILNLSGTADDHAIGELLSIDSGTGKLVADTGESQPFKLLEVITDPTADTLAWVRFVGSP